MGRIIAKTLLKWYIEFSKMVNVIPSSFKVIDFHAHFPVSESRFTAVYRKKLSKDFSNEKADYLLSKLKSTQVRSMEIWGFPPNIEPLEPMEQAKNWLEEIDKYDIEKIVFTTAGDNETMCKVVSIAPDRFIGFAHHNPSIPDAEKELEKCINEYGFRGMKIIAPLVDQPLNDRAFFPLWEVAEKYRIPIIIHFGVLGGGGGIGNHVNINPLIIHDVAKAFPFIPFVIAHFGCGYLKELLQLAWTCDNIHTDTSGNNDWVRWMPYRLTVEDLFEKCYHTIGPERILFGTDSSHFPRGFANRYLLDQLKICYQLRFPESDIKKIFRENALRLLKLEQ